MHVVVERQYFCTQRRELSLEEGTAATDEKDYIRHDCY
jgi:hypothetical protein